MTTQAQQYYVAEALVLVQTDDTLDWARHNFASDRIQLFQRPQVVSALQPLLRHRQPLPPTFSMFDDRFVSVYPEIERVNYQGVSPPNQVSLQYFTIPSTRLDDPQSEDQFHRWDHGQIFSFIKGQGSILMWASSDVPDFCDALWQETFTPPGPASLTPFRHFTAPAIPIAYTILFSTPTSPRIEPETDFRVPDHARALVPFRVPSYATPVIPTVTVRVRATAVGNYNNITRNIGDVFDVPAIYLALSSKNYLMPSLGFEYGWMIVVSSTTALVNNAPTAVTESTLPRTVY